MSDKDKQSKTTPLNVVLGITPEVLNDAGVLNTMVGTDTKLFIDPKLLSRTTIAELSGSRKVIHEYFADLVRINAQATKADRLKDMALGMIAIKEPIGLLIGYGNSRDSGTAIPLSVAQESLRSMNEMLLVGIEDLRVMQLLGLFIKRFGSDSISDLIAHIIYNDLCAYTQRLAVELGVDTKEFTIDGKAFQLPVHPYRGSQLIFIPLEIVRELPLATSWEEIAEAAAVNQDTRRAFNEMVGEDLEAYAIGIKKNPSLITASKQNLELLIDVYDKAEVKPYDPEKDAKSYIRITKLLSDLHGTLEPKQADVKSVGDMQTFIRDEIIGQFRREIEQLGKNRLLYHRNGEAVDAKHPVHEEASQIIFHGIADILCRNSNILVSRESKTGVGAVDFTIGNNYDNKIVVEIKKSDNANLLDGYKHQVEAYFEAEAAVGAAYVVVVVRDSNANNPDSQLNQLKDLHAERIRTGQTHPELHIIDGRIRETASKQKSLK